mmetsp:Transcript_4392/g.7438  ORF Transcript_4392/g.7438 Transcript_4392/m.7438 type:complete len:138 (+) Transcript_4392:305-718(+)
MRETEAVIQEKMQQHFKETIFKKGLLKKTPEQPLLEDERMKKDLDKALLDMMKKERRKSNRARRQSQRRRSTKAGMAGIVGRERSGSIFERRGSLYNRQQTVSQKEIVKDVMRLAVPSILIQFALYLPYTAAAVAIG